MSLWQATIYEVDGTTPELVVGTDPEGSNPYLLEPDSLSETRIDFAAGSSEIGGITVSILDKRTVSGEQGSGILTGMAERLVGRRLRLERWREDISAWALAFDGRIRSWRLDDQLTVYRFEVRDTRDFEQEDPMFLRNPTYAIWPEPGPVDGYGRLPSGDFMIPPVETELAIFETDDLPTTAGVYWGYAAIEGSDLLEEVGQAVFDTELGVFLYPDVVVRWRPNTGGDWRVLTDMPRDPEETNGESRPVVWMRSGSARGGDRLYVGSFDPADIPGDANQIELQVLANKTAPNTPYYWDRGSYGDLLQEIVDGLHTVEVPRERYDAAALTEFADSTPPCRFRITEPVRNRKTWVERNIYQPTLHAPALNELGEIVPIPWGLPDNEEALPLIEDAEIIPVGEWEHGIDNAVNVVEIRYERESIASPPMIEQKKARKIFGIKISRRLLAGKTVQVEDESVSPEERYFTTEVFRVRSSAPAIEAVGQRSIRLEPVTLRDTGDVYGRAMAGDALDERGTQLAEEYYQQVVARFGRGAATFRADARRTDDVEGLKVGDWIRVRPSWMPEYSTGKRGARRVMQVYGIDDSRPNVRGLSLVDGNVTDFDDVEDCFSGGELTWVDGKALRIFTASGTLVAAPSCEVGSVDIRVIGGGAGGGTPTTEAASGGGGAGGDQEWIAHPIQSGESYTVTVGDGGTAAADGALSRLWITSAGAPTADPSAARTSLGGGRGADSNANGQPGGSGGGGGANTTSVNSSAGGSGTAGQGFAGGGGVGTRFDTIPTRKTAGGGGGGSSGGVGSTGTARGADGSGTSRGGAAGIAATREGWGIRGARGGGGGGFDAGYDAASTEGGAGGGRGAAFSESGGGVSTAATPGSSYGDGGGGGAGTLAGAAGRAGCVAIRYDGPSPKLSVPVISATDSTDDGRVEVTIDPEDWPILPPDGYEVVIEYAFGDTEPDPDSGAWTRAGTLDEPGTVTIPPAPTGQTVWTRTTARAPGLLPSPKSVPVDQATPAPPTLLAANVEISQETNLAVVTWEPGAATGGVRVLWSVYPEAGSPSYDDEIDLDATDGTYTIPGEIPVGYWVSVIVVAWEDYSEPVPSASLFTDDFTRATVGGDYTQHSGTWAITSNRLTNTSGTNNQQISLNTIERGEMFVSAILRTDNYSNGAPGLLMRFERPGAAGTAEGYLVKVSASTSPRIATVSGTTVTDIASGSGSASANTNYRVQAYVADGVQEVWAPVGTVSATNTAHNGQNTRRTGFRHERFAGTPTTTYDDLRVFASKFIDVDGVPAGWTARLVDSMDATIAEEVSTGGLTRIDGSLFGGATQDITGTGAAALVILDDTLTEIDRLTQPIFPGYSVLYPWFAVYGEEGRSYTRSDFRSAPDFIRWTDLEPDADLSAGDLFYALGDYSLTRLPIGGTNHVLTVVGGLPTWSPNIAYSALPTGSGTWDPGAGETITIARALTLSGTPLTLTAASAVITFSSGTGTKTIQASASALTVQSSGALTLATTASNNNIGLTPHGSGIVYVGNPVTGSTTMFQLQSAVDGAQPAHFRRVVSATTGNQGVNQFSAVTTGAAEAGFGVQLAFQLPVASGGIVTAGNLTIRWLDPNGPTSTTSIVLRTRINNSVADRWQVGGAGEWEAIGAQTVKTSTGVLTLATGAGDGDVSVTPHGSGRLRFGTFVADATATIDGYIEIKEADGTTRYLATVTPTP